MPHVWCSRLGDDEQQDQRELASSQLRTLSHSAARLPLRALGGGSRRLAVDTATATVFFFFFFFLVFFILLFFID